VVTFSYDTNSPSRPRTVTDREGHVTTYGYDGTSQRLTSITDDNTHTALTLTYDGSGRVATQKDAKGLSTGAQTTFNYVTNGDGTKTTTVTSPATSYEPSWTPTIADTYDTSGRIIGRVAKPTSSSLDDVTTEYVYYLTGDLKSAKDGRLNVTRFCYDVDAAGNAVIGSAHNLTRRIDPAPDSSAAVPVTLFTYDLHDNLVRTIPPKGVSTGGSVDCGTDLSGSLNLAYATTMTYDSAGVKLVSTTRSYTDPDLGAQTATTTFEYDSAQPGLVSYVTPPRGNTGSSPDHTYATHFTYYGTGSKNGLLASVADPLGNTSTFDYDAVGRRTSMVDPTGTGSAHTWEYVYDNENRLRYAKAPPPSGSGSQLVTESRYDGVGNLLALLDANGQVTK
jgi:YD repeat-containing protein